MCASEQTVHAAVGILYVLTASFSQGHSHTPVRVKEIMPNPTMRRALHKKQTCVGIIIQTNACRLMLADYCNSYCSLLTEISEIGMCAVHAMYKKCNRAKAIPATK